MYRPNERLLLAALTLLSLACLPASARVIICGVTGLPACPTAAVAPTAAFKASAAEQAAKEGAPRAINVAVPNPFTNPYSSVVVVQAGTVSAWRPVLFQSANAALNSNLAAADMAACSGASGGDCIANAPERSKKDIAPDDGSPAAPIKTRRALVIGNTQYASPISSLPGTAKDSVDIAKALQKQGFEVNTLSDASRSATVTAFNKLITESGEDDSVIVFYAGHGHIHPGSASGFWLPADADVENPKTWISNADISRMFANINAKQILLVSDSCFSGALTREADTAANAATLLSANSILKQRSVAVMSSGGEEPVADSTGSGNSPFAEALLKRLASLDKDKEPIRAQSTLDDIRSVVSKNSAQTPQYGVLMSAGHSAGGDYLFGAK